MFRLPERLGPTDSHKPSVSGRPIIELNSCVQPMADRETVQISNEGKVAMFLAGPFILIHIPIFFVPDSAPIEACPRRQGRHDSSSGCVV